MQGVNCSALNKMSSSKMNELVKAIAAANEKFSHNLNQELSKLSKESKCNVVYSPMSITTVLTLLKAGAKGQTEADLQKVLNLPADSSNVNKGYLQLLKSFQAAVTEAVILKSANRVYTNVGFELNSDFVKTAKDYFLSEVEQLDFAKGHESAKKINGWVEEYTNKKIKDLIPPECLTPLTALVLVNGVYFKGLWQNQFDKAKTKKLPFYITENETKEVDMMYMEAKIPYTELEDSTCVVALPYKGDRLCMLLYLHDVVSTIAKLETSFKNIKVESVLKDMRSHDKVKLWLPRFKVESTHNLVPVLKQLGLKSIFDAKFADFGNITKVQDELYVSEVIQKAFIEVNEEGTEAAAATGVVATMRMLPHIIEFNANRPFLFQIVDKESNFILFAGKCADPSA